MHADHHYEIGTSHAECQDYALSGTKDGLSWAIVSDGCSASKNSDVGARVVALAAQKTLLGLGKKMVDGKFMEDSFHAVFYELIQSRIQSAKAYLGLDWDALDATLLLAYARTPEGTSDPVWGVMAIGDGNVIVKFADGSRTHVCISYDSGAPYYLSYNMCPEKDKGYIETFGTEKPMRTRQTHYPAGDGDTKVDEWKSDPTQQISYCLSGACAGLARVSQVALLSDGLGSFEGEGWMKDMDRTVKAVTDYKGLAGEFVKRRMRGFKRDCVAVGATHYDDLACAAITMVEV